MQLNYQVLSFLGNDSNIHENMMLPKLDTLVLLTTKGTSLDKKDEPWSKFKHGDEGMRKGIKNGVTSDDFRTLKQPSGVPEALDEIYKMSLHKFRPEAILGAASPYYWARPMYFRST